MGKTGTRAHAIDIFQHLPSAQVEVEFLGWLRLCLTEVGAKQSKIEPLHISIACVADEGPRVGKTSTLAHAIDIFQDLPSAHVEAEF